MTVKVVLPVAALDSASAPTPGMEHNHPPAAIDDDPWLDSDQVDGLQPGSRTSKKALAATS